MPITKEGFIEYKIPENIKENFTKEFLIDFYKNVIETFQQNDIRSGRKPIQYQNETYYSWWSYVENTYGFCESFRQTCKKYELNQVLDYYNKLEWYDSDLFDDELILLLVENGIVELGEPEAYED